MRIFQQTFVDYFSVRSLEVAYFWRLVLVPGGGGTAKYGLYRYLPL